MRTEEEVDAIIAEMVRKNKGKYITQACAFNKTCPRQMKMLKKALMSSVSFSGLVKEMLALRFEQREYTFESPKVIKGGLSDYPVDIPVATNEVEQNEVPKLKNVGNFI